MWIEADPLAPKLKANELLSRYLIFNVSVFVVMFIAFHSDFVINEVQIDAVLSHRKLLLHLTPFESCHDL